MFLEILCWFEQIEMVYLQIKQSLLLISIWGHCNLDNRTVYFISRIHYLPFHINTFAILLKIKWEHTLFCKLYKKILINIHVITCSWINIPKMLRVCHLFMSKSNVGFLSSSHTSDSLIDYLVLRLYSNTLMHKVEISDNCNIRYLYCLHY